MFQVLAMGGDGAVGTAWAMADAGADAPVGGGAAAALTHPLQTTVHCEYLGAWADVCRYKNLCFSGAPFNTVFISNQLQHKKLKGKPKQQPPIHASTKLFRVRAQLHRCLGPSHVWALLDPAEEGAGGCARTGSWLVPLAMWEVPTECCCCNGTRASAYGSVDGWMGGCCRGGGPQKVA